MTRLVVPRQLIDHGHALLRRSGARGFEALVLWAGRRRTDDPDVIDVELVLMPEQHAVHWDGGVALIVDGEALFEMNVMLNERGLRLVAQVHSHPEEAYHSETDDRYSVVTARGGISIVVPDFARDSFSIDACAVYRLEDGGDWTEVPPNAAVTLITIDEKL
jgi:hypothetical protein